MSAARIWGECRRKKRYRGRLAANRARARSEARTPGLQLRIYSCEHCGGYHLTKQEQP
jgi:hypothetical protein